MALDGAITKRWVEVLLALCGLHRTSLGHISGMTVKSLVNTARLKSIQSTFNELTERLGDPDVISDSKLLGRLSKERSDIEGVVLRCAPEPTVQ